MNSVVETATFDKSPPPKWLRKVPLAPSCGAAIKLLSSLTESPPDRPDAAPPSEDDVSDLILFIQAELPSIRRKCTAALNPAVRATLTDDDYLYIMAYTAAEPYPLYNLVNAWVMCDRRSPAAAPIVGPFVKGLILALLKLDPVVVPGFRAIRVRSIPGLVRAFEQWETVLARGQPVNFWSFASFTTDPRILSDPTFSGGPNERAIIYQSENLVGVDIGTFSVAPRDEKEVLAIPPAMFQVVVCMQVPNTQKIVCTVRMIDNGAYEYAGASAGERQKFTDLLLGCTLQSPPDPAQASTTQVASKPSPASPPASPAAPVPIPAWVAALGVDEDLQQVIASLHFSKEDELAAVTEKDLTDNGVAIGLRKRFFDFTEQRRGARLEQVRQDARKCLREAEQELDTAKEASDEVAAVVAKAESELKAIEAEEAANQTLYDVADAEYKKLTAEQGALDSTIVQLEEQIKQYTEMVLQLSQQSADIETSKLTLRNRLTVAERHCEECAILQEVLCQQDSVVSNCPKCHAAFGFLKRKHHCGACGVVFCDSCCSARVRPPGFPATIRACESCALKCSAALEKEEERSTIAEEMSLLQKQSKALAPRLVDVETKRSEAIQELEMAEKRRTALPKEITSASAAVASARASLQAIRDRKSTFESALDEQKADLGRLQPTTLAMKASAKQARLALDQANVEYAVWVVETQGGKAGLTCELWTALGNRAASSPLTIKGVRYSAERCFVEAIDGAAGKSNVTDLGRAWIGLASTLATPQSVVRVAGHARTKRDCCMEALTLGEPAAVLWLMLAETILTPKETVEVDNVPYTAMECCVKAVELDSDLGTAWAQLAKSMSSGKVPTVTCIGRQFGLVQCCVEALQRNCTLSLAWAVLGRGMNATAKMQVNGVSYTQRQCYVEALRYDPKNSYAWNNLGINLNAIEQVQVNAVSYTRRQCYVEALLHDPKYSNAWNNLGIDLNATEQAQIAGLSYTQRQCYLQALKHNPKLSNAWNGLGNLLNPAEQVQVNGVSYTNRLCYLEALKHDPMYSNAWNGLGVYMSATEQVQVNGVSYTKRQCFLEALKHDPKLANAWSGLGLSMNATEQVLVNGRSYTQLQCYVEALKKP